MRFSPVLLEAKLLRRYKRFLADVQTHSGAVITVYCPNTGAMLGCADPGSRVWLSESARASRKYRFTWELVEDRSGVLVGIHSAYANTLVKEALGANIVQELTGYDVIRQEVRYGLQNSRVDFVLERDTNGEQCFVEVKSVTASVERGYAIFPDAVSKRGTRHLRELALIRQGGTRAVLCYCVQRNDVDEVQVAASIDPAYAAALRTALQAGVEVIAYTAEVSPLGIHLLRKIKVKC